jgi:protein-disulfide isomerase
MSTADEPEDLTRKQRREAAREERKAAEAAEAAKSARQRRLLLLGGALGAAVIIVVIAIVVSSSGSSSGPSHNGISKNTPEVVKQVESVIGGVPQSGNTLGSPSAPVTLDYYGDLQCPICQEFSLNTLPTVINDLVKTGKMKIVYRDLQTATRDANIFQQQQVAAAAAGPQQKAWWYIELFYKQQGAEGSNYVNTAFLDKIASQIPGLDTAKWQAAQSDPQYAAGVKANEQKAAQLSFNSTPTLVMIGPKGSKGTVGAVPASTIQQLYQSVA